MTPLAVLDSRLVTALAVIGGLVVLGGLLFVTSAGEIRGRRKARVPAAFRPGPSDEELERSVLIKYQAWGGIAALFVAIWLPVYWLREPTRLAEKRVSIRNDEINNESHASTGGKVLFSNFCARCHGPGGEGGPQVYGVDGIQREYAEPPLKYIYGRYKAAGRNEDEITQLINDAINRGRPGTPMPTWSIAFGGPMISHQVDTLVEFIQSIQEDPTQDKNLLAADMASSPSGKAIFLANCATCHGRNPSDETGINLGAAAGRGMGLGALGPNLSVALQRLTHDQLIKTIKTGRLNGNRPSMPSWAFLGDDAINALVRFIESIQRS